MDNLLGDSWKQWRAASPLSRTRPPTTDLPHAAHTGMTLDDVLPYPSDAQNAGLLRLLIVGTNPSPWAAAVQAPFARPGNRFWKGLQAGGITPGLVNDSNGMDRADERMLTQRGVGITNIVARPSSRASELSRQELTDGCAVLVARVRILQPRVVAFTGITAFRMAFQLQQAMMGLQTNDTIST